MKPPLNIFSNGAYVAFLLAVSLISLGVVLIGWETHRLYQDLLSRGIQTQGTVTAKEVRQGLRGGNIRYFHYSYGDSKGRIHSAVTSTIVLNVGSSVDVTYLPDDPAQHVPFVVKSGNLWQPLKAAVLFASVVVGTTIGFGFILQILLNVSGSVTVSEDSKTRKRDA